MSHSKSDSNSFQSVLQHWGPPMHLKHRRIHPRANTEPKKHKLAQIILLTFRQLKMSKLPYPKYKILHASLNEEFPSTNFPELFRTGLPATFPFTSRAPQAAKKEATLHNRIPPSLSLFCQLCVQFQSCPCCSLSHKILKESSRWVRPTESWRRHQPFHLQTHSTDPLPTKIHDRWSTGLLPVVGSSSSGVNRMRSTDRWSELEHEKFWWALQLTSLCGMLFTSNTLSWFTLLFWGISMEMLKARVEVGTGCFFFFLVAKLAT